MPSTHNRRTQLAGIAMAVAIGWGMPTNTLAHDPDPTRADNRGSHPTMEAGPCEVRSTWHGGERLSHQLTCRGETWGETQWIETDEVSWTCGPEPTMTSVSLPETTTKTIYADWDDRHTNLQLEAVRKSGRVVRYVTEDDAAHDGFVAALLDQGYWEWQAESRENVHRVDLTGPNTSQYTALQVVTSYRDRCGGNH